MYKPWTCEGKPVVPVWIESTKLPRSYIEISFCFWNWKKINKIFQNDMIQTHYVIEYI